jgi:hypothetical protein
VCAGLRGADLLEEAGAGGGAGQVGPHREGVDEEPDDVVVLAPAAVRGGDADNDVSLGGKAGEQQ